MRSAWRAATALALTAALVAPALAQDAPQGRYLAANCANCHGTGGQSAGVMPSLAGLPRERIVTAMSEFKAGKRPATIMHQLAKGYTDAQIELMAAYFAAQPRR
jgi:cytochrome subunit of sulfide dehydrogenase